jgi:hypothetical protein
MSTVTLSRKLAGRLFAAALLLAIAGSASAAGRYVNLNCASPSPPYTNWTTAATNIQDAVDAAVAGDEIVVTNGIYRAGGRGVNCVTVDKPLTLRSANGPEFTIIDGGYAPNPFGWGGLRCVYLTSGASLSGFTLANGWALPGGGFDYSTAIGGGLLCESASAVASNCVVSGNSALGSLSFPPVRIVVGNGGGVYGGTLNDCILKGNQASGASAYNNGSGGGACNATLNNCMVIGNSALVGGQGGGAYHCVLNNCTLTGNSVDGGGGGASLCTLNNCIVYFNMNGNFVEGTLSYCCTTPDPGGVGNITNAPLFVDTNGWANLRLQSNSPCINAGNNTWVTNAVDLDGDPRIAGGTVDIGAYEFRSPASMISYTWLQKYGLPTDGSADTADPDGDGLNNWQEWRCGTDPTNALSALRLLGPAPVGSGLVVRWESVAGRTYFLERSTTASTGFTPLATGILGQPGTTTFTDTNAIGAGPLFYRVGVSTQ